MLASAKGKEYELKLKRVKALEVARELCYSDRIKEGIKHAVTEIEIQQWLKQGRMEL